VALVVAAMAASGCGSEFVRSSRSPSQLVVVSILTAASTTGAVPTSFVNGPLLSDVVEGGGTVFNDFGQVTLRAMLRDQGSAGVPAAPSDVNDVTITRYRVSYRRSDGRNTPGVDVPHPFDGAMTFTVPAGETAAGVFELVRHVAKLEPPLSQLATNLVVLTMVADVTFYGRDQAGNEVTATGTVQVNAANYGDE
jgi:hypothetical protein